MQLTPNTTNAHASAHPVPLPLDANELLHAAITADGMPIEWAVDHARSSEGPRS